MWESIWNKKDKLESSRWSLMSSIYIIDDMTSKMLNELSSKDIAEKDLLFFLHHQRVFFHLRNLARDLQRYYLSDEGICKQLFDDVNENQINYRISTDDGEGKIVEPEYIHSTVLDECTSDIDIVHQAFNQRRFVLNYSSDLKHIPPAFEQLKSLYAADQLGMDALVPAMKAGYIEKETQVITHLQQRTEARMIPYYKALLVGMSYSVGTIESYGLEYLAIPHEIAHYLYWHGIIQSEVDEVEDPTMHNILKIRLTRLESLDWRRDWLEELFADVYGCLIAGPVNVLGCQELLIGNADVVFHEDTDEHPIPILRPLMQSHILRLLAKRTMRFDFAASLDELDKRWLATPRIYETTTVTGQNPLGRRYELKGLPHPLSGQEIIDRLTPVFETILDLLQELIERIEPWSHNEPDILKLYLGFVEKAGEVIHSPDHDLDIALKRLDLFNTLENVYSYRWGELTDDEFISQIRDPDLTTAVNKLYDYYAEVLTVDEFVMALKGINKNFNLTVDELINTKVGANLPNALTEKLDEYLTRPVDDLKDEIVDPVLAAALQQLDLYENLAAEELRHEPVDLGLAAALMELTNADTTTADQVTNALKTLNEVYTKTHQTEGVTPDPLLTTAFKKLDLYANLVNEQLKGESSDLIVAAALKQVDQADILSAAEFALALRKLNEFYPVTASDFWNNTIDQALATALINKLNMHLMLPEDDLKDHPLDTLLVATLIDKLDHAFYIRKVSPAYTIDLLFKDLERHAFTSRSGEFREAYNAIRSQNEALPEGEPKKMLPIENWLDVLFVESWKSGGAKNIQNDYGLFRRIRRGR